MMDAYAAKLVILDRDGVINVESPEFIKTPAEWIPLPGALEAMARLTQAGWHIVVCTNQSGLGRGLFDIVALNAIHQKMHDAAKAAGAHIEAVFFCPHRPDEDCSCRKPKPGMLQDLAARLHLSLDGVPTIGDSLRDLQAGFTAGCRPFLVLTGNGPITQETGGLPPGTRIVKDLSAAVDVLLAEEAERAVVAGTPPAAGTSLAADHSAEANRRLATR